MGSSQSSSPAPLVPNRASSFSNDSGTNQSRHKEIEKQLKKDVQQSRSLVKILLLGGAETGKTTFFKQMRILHLNGFGHHDLVTYRYTIHQNVVHSMQQLLNAAVRFRIVHETYTQRQIHLFHEHLEQHTAEGATEAAFLQLQPEMGGVIQSIWQSGTVQMCFKRRYEFQLMDGAKHLLDSVVRITERDYLPSHQDVLHCRYQTTGINQLSFPYKGLQFLMVDVGGQKTERRKWIHCFDDVTLVLFVIALSDLNLPDQDDANINRLQNNLEIFRTIVRSQHFKEAGFTLFMNKSDLFSEKIKNGEQLNVCFTDYEGDNSYEDCVNFIISKFQSCVTKPKMFFPFVTKATDTNNVQKVFSAAFSHIVANNMKSMGMHS